MERDKSKCFSFHCTSLLEFRSKGLCLQCPPPPPATQIEWFVDGVLRHVRVTGSPPDLYIPQWPFYVILNTALTPWSSSEADVGYPLYHVVDRVTMCKPVAARSISTSR